MYMYTYMYTSVYVKNPLWTGLCRGKQLFNEIKSRVYIAIVRTPYIALTVPLNVGITYHPTLSPYQEF